MWKNQDYEVLIIPGRESNSRPASNEVDAIITNPRPWNETRGTGSSLRLSTKPAVLVPLYDWFLSTRYWFLSSSSLRREEP